VRFFVLICAAFVSIVAKWYNWHMDVATTKASDSPPEGKRKFGGSHPMPANRKQRRQKLVLVQRNDLDRRSLAYRDFEAQIASIKADLGNGVLSTIETQLIENFACLSVMMNAATVDLLLGKKVDIATVCMLASTAMRIGGRLGLRRRAKDVSAQSLGSYLGNRGKSRGSGTIIRFSRRRESDSLRACRCPRTLTIFRLLN
jgi:hypothetical protein